MTGRFLKFLSNQAAYSVAIMPHTLYVSIEAYGKSYFHHLLSNIQGKLNQAWQ